VLETDQPRITVASWPDSKDEHNPFMRIFLGGLEDAGCRVTGINSLKDISDVVDAEPDIFLVHWAERIFAEAKSRQEILANVYRLLTAIAKLRPQTRVVWVVHNLAPHDSRRFQRLVWPPYIWALSRSVDAFLTLAPDTVAQVKANIPALAKKKGHGAWHPAYPDANISFEEKIAAREEMGIPADTCVLGYCGQIRPYKGVEDLLDRFLETSDPSLRLLLAGRPEVTRPGAQDFVVRLQEKAQKDARVLLKFTDLDANDYKKTLGACDVIVAPFRNYLHSGSLVHALSAGKPILTPQTPFAESFAKRLGQDWVRLYSGDLSVELLEKQRALSKHEQIKLMDAKAVGVETVSFFRQIIGSNPI